MSEQEYQTREKIAELLWSSAAEVDDDPRWTWAYLTERADRSEGDYSQIRAEYYGTADAVLALFPQPTPSTEPTVQVPVGLIQQTERALGEDAWHPEGCPGNHPAYCTCAVGRARRALRGMLAETTPTAPPSIAEMAPGTTFWKGGDTWTVRTGGVVEDDIGQIWPASRIDPSTIRDVQIPPEFPNAN